MIAFTSFNGRKQIRPHYLSCQFMWWKNHSLRMMNKMNGNPNEYNHNKKEERISFSNSDARPFRIHSQWHGLHEMNYGLRIIICLQFIKKLCAFHTQTNKKKWLSKLLQRINISQKSHLFAVNCLLISSKWKDSNE